MEHSTVKTFGGALEESAKTERRAREVAGKQERGAPWRSHDQIYKKCIPQSGSPIPLQMGERATCLYNEEKSMWRGDNPE